MTIDPSDPAAAAGIRDSFAQSTEEVFASLSKLDWAFADADTGSGGHDVHPYPAKFPPQLPQQIVQRLSTVGQIVLDPFGGSGTTALVALDEGRSAVSLDANPVAVVMTRAKARGLLDSERETLIAFAASVESESFTECSEYSCEHLAIAPVIPNVEKWFSLHSVHELCHVRHLVGDLDGACRDAAELAVGQTAATVSFQDSETRYVSVPRIVRERETLETFAHQLRKITKRLRSSSNRGQYISVQHGDARNREAFKQPSGSVDLVVTSPPYPNAYDYHLYHRFRILWTMADPGDLRRVEIGSHLRQQSIKDPIVDYESDMSQVAWNAFDLLRPGGWCVFVVGDGKYKGSIYSTSTSLASVAERAGFHVAGVIERALPANRRSVTSAGRRLRVEQLVFLRKPQSVEAEPPEWAMSCYEQTLAERELAAIEASEGDSSRFQRLTFATRVTVDGEAFETHQWQLERTDETRRKNSTYASHGIHRYKGKFYPQLGRCLLNLSCEPGSLVVDPFTGSGTVGLEASLLQHEFHGIELSPVGAATARAKVDLMRARPGLLEEATSYIGQSLRKPDEGIVWSEFAPATHEELTSWFAPKVLARISSLLASVRSMSEQFADGDVAVQLAEVCVSDLIRDVSHQDPSDLRIRRRADPLDDAEVENLFFTRWDVAVKKIRSAQNVLPESPGSARVVCGDSTDPGNWPTNANGSPRAVDAIVTSPPYAAALPYLDTDRLSIAAVFGKSKGDRTILEGALVGSREIRTGDLRTWKAELYSGEVSHLLPTSTISFLQALSEAVDCDTAAGFRRRQGPAVLTRYFVAMSRVLALVSERLRVEGSAWFVLGDSKTTIGGHTWTIPTTQEIAVIAKHHGLEVIEQIPITVTRDNMRHARNAITANTLLHFKK